jgi:ATP-dependent Lhr-like helicase
MVKRRLLARIHRLTVATLRKQGEPVTAAQFMRWLLRWQHINSGSQVRGERATLGFCRSYKDLSSCQCLGRQFWRGVFSVTIRSGLTMCLTGAVGWGRCRLICTLEALQVIEWKIESRIEWKIERSERGLKWGPAKTGLAGA